MVINLQDPNDPFSAVSFCHYSLELFENKTYKKTGSHLHSFNPHLKYVGDGRQLMFYWMALHKIQLNATSKTKTSRSSTWMNTYSHVVQLLRVVVTQDKLLQQHIAQPFLHVGSPRSARKQLCEVHHVVMVTAEPRQHVAQGANLGDRRALLMTQGQARWHNWGPFYWHGWTWMPALISTHVKKRGSCELTANSQLING